MNDLPQTEEDFPIDIHSNKLLDWLINRRHCKHEWQASVLIIRQKINNAIQDMPAVDDITQLLSGTYINYYHCLRIVELLKETESESKNIFGRYSSKRMKDWQEIVKLYQKDNIGLAEAAQLLMRNVNYEIPSLKKQISKCQQIQKECERKEADCISNSNMLREKFYSACKQIGIEGKKIKSELMKLLDNLPQILISITATTQNLKEACQFYTEFVAFTLQNPEKSQNCLEMISFLQKKGNCTVFEWRTGKKPLVIEEPKRNIEIDDEKDDEEQQSSDQIDFGESIDYGDLSLESIQVIDFPEDSNGNGISVDDDKIDFGDISPSIDFGDDDKIDFEIVPSASDLESNGEQNVAHGTDALSILTHLPTRNNFINELLELEAFLEQRMIELKTEGDILMANQFQSAAPSIQLQNLDTLTSMLIPLKSILADLMSVKTQNLFLLQSSSKHIDRVTESLKQKLSIADRALELQKTYIKKREAALEEQAQLEPKLDLIILRTKELQSQIELDISAVYKNRKVNIMGGISAI